MAWVVERNTQSTIVQRRYTEIGSFGDELRLLDFTSLLMSTMDTVLKLASSLGDYASGRTKLQGWALLPRFFSTKYEEKVGMRRGCLKQSDLSSL